MNWTVQFHDAFDSEFAQLPDTVQNGLLAHANMKELRFDADNGVWRFAFVFDPNRETIILVGGDKSGGGEKRFYRQLIQKADERFDEHISSLEQTRK